VTTLHLTPRQSAEASSPSSARIAPRRGRSVSGDTSYPGTTPPRAQPRSSGNRAAVDGADGPGGGPRSRCGSDRRAVMALGWGRRAALTSWPIGPRCLLTGSGSQKPRLHTDRARPATVHARRLAAPRVRRLGSARRRHERPPAHRTGRGHPR